MWLPGPSPEASSTMKPDKPPIENSTLRIALLGPPGMMRDALARSLLQLWHRTEVVGAASLEELHLLPRSKPFHLAILDADVPGMDLLTLVEGTRTALAGVPFVVMGAAEGRQPVERALDAGARGYVPKSTPEMVMLEALRLVRAGGVYLPPSVMQGLEPRDATPAPDIAPAPEHKGARLTDRQLDVLACMAGGDTNKVIARKLGIAEKTVKIHVSAICAALGVVNRTQAAIVALRLPEVRRRLADEAGSGKVVLGWLLPFAECRKYRAGDVIFRKGQSSDQMYYLAQGEVRLVEIDKHLVAGELFGELGLFLPDHVRTLTAQCVTQVELYAISEEAVMQLYFQNPQFAFQIVRLVAQRLAQDLRRAIVR
jgi:DNA-binding NarL/FixJ family response regulator